MVNSKSKKNPIKLLDIIDEQCVKRELITLDVQNNSINGWTDQNEEWFRPFLSRLKYYRVINNFHFFELKKKEGQLSWGIIVISTFSSALSLLNTDKNIFPNASIAIKWTLVVLTMITTLISAYIKKQQFIDKINTIDRYLQQLNQVVEEINITFILEPNKREHYDEFCAKYIPLIKNLSVFPSSFSPSSWKRTVYNITTSYPELIEGDGTNLELLWPWYHIIPPDNIEEQRKEKISKKTNFEKLIRKTYHPNRGIIRLGDSKLFEHHKEDTKYVEEEKYNEDDKYFLNFKNINIV
jgi:hypothetical protein